MIRIVQPLEPENVKDVNVVDVPPIFEYQKILGETIAAKDEAKVSELNASSYALQAAETSSRLPEQVTEYISTHNEELKGYTPIKGIDYFDGKDGQPGKDGLPGQDGKDGVDGKDGKDGVDGYTPQKGIDYFDGKDGKDGEIPADKLARIDQNTETLNQELLQIERLTDKQNEIAEDVRLLKHFAKGELYTEYTDNTEAHEKQVPKSADEKALLNSVGGHSVVVNQLVNTTATASAIMADGVRVTRNNNKFTVVALKDDNTSYSGAIRINVNRKTNHKYFYAYTINSSSNIKAYNNNINGGVWANGVDVVAGKDTRITMLLTVQTTDQTNISCGAVANTLKQGESYDIFDVNLIDITQMFGVDVANSLTLGECQQIFTEYIPYTEPTIKHITTDSVVVRGKNLLDEASVKNVSNWEIYDYQDARGRYKLSLDVGKQYVASVNPDSLLNKGYYLYIAKYEKGAPASTSLSTTIIIQSTVYKNYPFTVEEGYDYYLWIYAGTGAISCIRDIENIQIEEGTTPTDYVPYVAPVTIPLPTAEQDGYSAGNVCNERDFARGKRVKKITKVDLGSLAWTIDSRYTHTQFYATLIDVMLNTKNAICEKFILSNNTAWNDKEYGTFGIGTKYLVIAADFANATDFKQSVQGVNFYYELAEYEETDLEDTINPLIVEGNGSVEFVNTEQSKVPIPSSISYCVSTKEGL